MLLGFSPKDSGEPFRCHSELYLLFRVSKAYTQGTNKLLTRYIRLSWNQSSLLHKFFDKYGNAHLFLRTYSSFYDQFCSYGIRS